MGCAPAGQAEQVCPLWATPGSLPWRPRSTPRAQGLPTGRSRYRSPWHTEPRAQPWAPGEDTAPVPQASRVGARAAASHGGAGGAAAPRGQRPGGGCRAARSRQLLCPGHLHSFPLCCWPAEGRAERHWERVGDTWPAVPQPGAAQPQRFLPPQADTEPGRDFRGLRGSAQGAPRRPRDLCACSPGSLWGGAWARYWWAGGFVATSPGPLGSLGLLPQRSSWWVRTSSSRLGGTPVWAGGA